MPSELFWPVVILGSFITFIIVPILLYTGLKKIVNPVPFWLPVLLAIIAFIVTQILPPKDPGMVTAIVSALLFFGLNALVVIIPLPLFRKQIDLENTKNVCFILIAAAFIEIFCLTYSILNQHDMMIGRSWTHAIDRFPFFVGWLIDGVIQFYHATDYVYAYESKVYYLIMSAGYYLEVILVSGVLYAGLCFLFPLKRPGQSP
jgi:hypothetical protein